MSLPGFATDSITRKRYPIAEDGHGNDLPDFTAQPDELQIHGCSVQQGLSQEYLGGRDTNLIRWTVYAPLAADVIATDIVTWDSVDYLVDGEPVRNTIGRLAHTVVLLKLWEG